ncbi:serine hydrolase domain-containing protein [Streptomyces eurythermus]|uniref:serine hydrolase domain-containing protein n=1 Tax=Streptomyces eurythermus TaxID=42237 RepID=UPI0033EB9EA5
MTAAVPASAAPRATSHHSTHSATQDALDAITRGGTPGVLARADRAGEVWHGTSGVADLRTGRPRLPRDRFRIGSLTKPFIATVVLQLAAEPVYGLSIDGRRITLRRLLQHTSGLYDYIDDDGFRATFTGPAFLSHRYDGATPEELVRTDLAHEPLFDPGDGWSYSNTNYILAGMVIEKATGNSYATAVERRIIRPLGLRGTTVPGTSSSVPGPHGRHYSKLYVDDPAARVHDITDFNPSVSGASGEIISTTRDLNTFIRAAGRTA